MKTAINALITTCKGFSLLAVCAVSLWFHQVNAASGELERFTQQELELAEIDIDNDPFYSTIEDPELLDELLIIEEEEMLRYEQQLLESGDLEKLAEAEPEPVQVTDEEVQDIFEREFGLGVDSGPYRLRIGDVMYVSIYGEPGTGRQVTVDHTGNINYLLVGEFFVLGKTIDQVRAEMNEAIKSYFKHAFVAVTPTRFGSQYYTVLGEVRNPGKKVIQGSTSLLDALAMSGGLREGVFRTQTIDLADLGHAFLARNGEYIPVDFDKLVTQGDLSEDIELANGDYIYIPNVLYREIHILGEVKSPTTIGFVNTVSLVEAIAQARGLTDRASSRMVVIRGSLSDPETYHIDINLILRGFEPDFLLQPGDIVYAPIRKFQNLRELVRMGIRAFVLATAGVAGDKAFEYIHPHAKGDDNDNNPFIPFIPVF